MIFEFTQALRLPSLFQTKWHALAIAAHHTKINTLAYSQDLSHKTHCLLEIMDQSFLALPNIKSCGLRLGFYNLWFYYAKYTNSWGPHLCAPINSHNLSVKIIAPISTKALIVCSIKLILFFLKYKEWQSIVHSKCKLTQVDWSI